MCPRMDPHYTLTIQDQADLAREVSQDRLATRVRAGRVRGGIADDRLHGAAVIRLAHVLKHDVVHLRRGSGYCYEDAAQPRHAD